METLKGGGGENMREEKRMGGLRGRKGGRKNIRKNEQLINKWQNERTKTKELVMDYKAKESEEETQE